MSIENHDCIPIIIPAYEPDERLSALIKELIDSGLKKIIIVDDGSGNGYMNIFNSVAAMGAEVLRHDINMGKGAALKTAFRYCLDNISELKGCVTADSDGQHSVECITKCIEALEVHSGSLIMGCRDFTLPGIPKASIIGNMNTNKIIRHLYGKNMTDTQTGLRGIPKQLMEECLNIKHNRFEFEIKMLINALETKVEIVEVPIKTIYDSQKNHATHFKPIRDTLKIYKAIGFFRSAFVLIFRR